MRKADQIEAASLVSENVNGFDDESVTEESTGSDESSYSSDEEYANMIATAAVRVHRATELGQVGQPSRSLRTVSIAT